MKGAIFFASKYGSTAQYAKWISEATGIPMFDIRESTADPEQYDFLILGAPIIYYKLYNHKWMKENLSVIARKPTVLFTVSGASAGPKLDQWIADCIPKNLVAHVKHIALQGRQKPEELTWYDRTMLKIAARFNKDPKARNEELHGFDFMNKSTIKQVVQEIGALQVSPAII